LPERLKVFEAILEKMKTTYNWLKDFVDIKIPPEQLAEKLTMAGLEVTSLEKQEGDCVFEIEITSNRPDWLSVIGIAREVAAITGQKLKLGSRFSAEHLTPNTEHRNLTIHIEDKKDCPLYTAKIIRDVKVGPSPDWLKKRLEFIGCRSVNNVVDITNYILFEYGEPLHAFDLDKVDSDTLVVRRAKDGEKIIAIDEQEKALSPDILVIANQVKPLAIAGIMGGKDSEVSLGTKNVLLEAAVFNPLLIRRSRQKLGLQTDSAYRFERGVDAQTAQFASWRATRLIQEIAGGRLVLAKSAGSILVKAKIISLDAARVEKILGVKIGAAQISKILSGLGFKIKTKSKNKLAVEIPRHRQDIFGEIDLIEEIARIFGYENIPVTLPAVKPRILSDRKRELVSLIKNTLAGLGLNEVITYSLLDRSLLKLSGYEQGVEVLNPLSREQEILRPILTLSLARCVAYNLNQKQEYVNIFEISNIFSLVDNLPRQELSLGIAVSGTRSWLSNQGLIKDEAGFLHLKGMLEILFARLGIREYSFGPLKNSSEAVISINRQDTGRIVKLEKKILEAMDIKNKEVLAVELSLEKLFSFADLQKKLNPLPIYPGIGRDISLLSKDDLLAEDILKAVRQAAGPLLKEIKIADFYRGKQVPQGFKSLTISCLYRAEDRTLTDLEVNLLHEPALTALKEKFSVQIR
jgi:phenylalanyl-tRNA synthetase beta chain